MYNTNQLKKLNKISILQNQLECQNNIKPNIKHKTPKTIKAPIIQ